MSPTYLNVCKSCGHEEERFWPTIRQAEEEMRHWKCPVCGNPDYRRKPTPFTWHFGDAMRSKD